MGCNCKESISVNTENKNVYKKKTYSILDIIKDYIFGNLVYIDLVGKSKRLNVCNICDRLSITRQCKECGCFVDLKVKYHKSNCPLNKWEK